MKPKEIVKEFFSSKAKSYYKEQYAQETNAVIRNRRVLEMINETGLNILDIGCGVGVLAHLLEVNGNYVSACDNSEEMVDEARNRHFNINYSIKDAENLNYKENSFDYVTAIGLFEYLENDEKALKEIHRVLKPNGYVIIEFNNKCWHNKMNDFKPADDKYPMSRRCHNPFTISKEYEKYGFVLDDLCFFHLDDKKEDEKCRKWEAPYTACAFIVKLRKVK